MAAAQKNKHRPHQHTCAVATDALASVFQRTHRMLLLTFVQRGELPHLRRQALVELVLPRNEGLADGLLPEPQHTRVASHLVHEGLKHDPFPGVRSPIRLHEGFQSGTHPHSASDS